MHRSRDGVAKFANHVVHHLADEKVILDDEDARRGREHEFGSHGTAGECGAVSRPVRCHARTGGDDGRRAKRPSRHDVGHGNTNRRGGDQSGTQGT